MSKRRHPQGRHPKGAAAAMTRWTDPDDADQAHPVDPEPHTITATYRWANRVLQGCRNRLGRALDSLAR